MGNLQQKERNITIQFVCAIISLVTGMFLLIYGICVEPAGEIHNSVLVAIGEVFTFVGSCLGIDVNYKKAMLRNGDADKN